MMDTMRLTPKQRDAMIWLGEPATPETFVTDEMLKELATLGIIDYDPATGDVRFTEDGKLAYRDSVGHWPNSNV